MTQTALAGFLSTLSAGTISVNSLAAAASRWENVQHTLPHSSAGVAELGRLLQGKGKPEVMFGHIWAALTTDESVRLRDFLLSVGAAVPATAGLAEILQGAIDWVYKHDPYSLNKKVGSQTLKHLRTVLGEDRDAAEERVAELDEQRTAGQAQVCGVKDDIIDKRIELDQAHEVLDSPACQVQPSCRKAMQRQVKAIEKELSRLTGKALPRAEKALQKTVDLLNREADHAAALIKALSHVGTAINFLDQVLGLVEETRLVRDEQTTGAVTFFAT